MSISSTLNEAWCRWMVTYIRLTLGLYTYVELHDQTAALELLPAPPKAENRDTSRRRSA